MVCDLVSQGGNKNRLINVVMVKMCNFIKRFKQRNKFVCKELSKFMHWNIEESVVVVTLVDVEYPW